jgi:hypothetical protein
MTGFAIARETGHAAIGGAAKLARFVAVDAPNAFRVSPIRRTVGHRGLTWSLGDYAAAIDTLSGRCPEGRRRSDDDPYFT